MSEAVVDSSAILAYLRSERGGLHVEQVLAAGAVVSAVNLSEVVAKLTEAGTSEEVIRATLSGLDFDSVATFDIYDAYLAGLLRPKTRRAGLSLGDRACLALAHRLGLPVLTADAAWAQLDLGIAVTVIR